MSVPTQEEVNQVVVHFLILNQFHFKEASAVYKARRAEVMEQSDPCFHDEIDEQYRDMVKSMLLDAITKQFGFTTESVLIMLESLNIDEYV